MSLGTALEGWGAGHTGRLPSALEWAGMRVAVLPVDATAVCTVDSSNFSPPLRQEGSKQGPVIGCLPCGAAAAGRQGVGAWVPHAPSENSGCWSLDMSSLKPVNPFSPKKRKENPLL